MSWPNIHRRPETDKQCEVITYLCDTLDEHGPQTAKEIAQGTGYRDVRSALWSLRFRGIVRMERAHGELVVFEVWAP
jgi:hypothetical protein